MEVTLTKVLKQVQLQYGKEPLQIPYPPEFAGEKTKEDVDVIYISSQPRMMTSDEAKVVEDYLTQLPYRQRLSYTGLVFIDGSDPLLSYSHSQLDELEKHHSLQKTRYVPGSGERSVYERVLIIREAGFTGNSLLSLASGR